MRRRTNDLADYRNATAQAPANPGPCACGRVLTKVRRSVKIHGPYGSAPYIVFDFECKHCVDNTEHYWSGDDEAIHRHSRTSAITYEVHRELCMELKESRPSVHEFWKRKSQLSLTETNFLSLSTFQEAFWSITRAMDMDFTSLFTCNVGDNPCGDFITAPVLIVDGKALTARPHAPQEGTELVCSALSVSASICIESLCHLQECCDACMSFEHVSKCCIPR